MAHRTREPRLIAHVAATVVLADCFFTATAVVVQPVTGAWLMHLMGWSLGEGWIVLSLGLYVMVGLFWLPVVFIQIRMRDLALKAAAANAALPDAYRRLFRVWLACGFPAFGAVLAIVWLMLARPAIRLAG
jgi:uncharacterized membrane protein